MHIVRIFDLSGSLAFGVAVFLAVLCLVTQSLTSSVLLA